MAIPFVCKVNRQCLGFLSTMSERFLPTPGSGPESQAFFSPWGSLAITRTRKSNIWPPIGSISFTLTFVLQCFCYYNHQRMLCVAISIHSGLPWGTCPSAWKLNYGVFVQLTGKHPAPAHQWMVAGMDTSPPQKPTKPGDTWQYLFTLLPSCSPSLSYKRNRHPVSNKTVL